MTDRKLTCAACKSAITKGDIAGSDLEFGGELKATNQPEYNADADTDLVATVGTLDEYTPMVRTTGNQSIGGIKTFQSAPIMTRGVRINTGYDVNNPNPDAVTHSWPIEWIDNNGIRCAYIEPILGTDGKISLFASIRNTDGTEKGIVLVVSSI